MNWWDEMTDYEVVKRQFDEKWVLLLPIDVFVEKLGTVLNRHLTKQYVRENPTLLNKQFQDAYRKYKITH